jgi:hypothetical protein
MKDLESKALANNNFITAELNGGYDNVFNCLKTNIFNLFISEDKYDNCYLVRSLSNYKRDHIVVTLKSHS